MIEYDLYFFSGHGDGDCGATGQGTTEEITVKRLTSKIVKILRDNGYRTIAIEHHQKDNVTDRVAIVINQVQAVQGNQTAQNVSTHCYCRSGDKIKLSVKQTSENALSLVEWSHSVVMTCSRV